jgi:hypothetical protein
MDGLGRRLGFLRVPDGIGTTPVAPLVEPAQIHAGAEADILFGAERPEWLQLAA